MGGGLIRLLLALLLFQPVHLARADDPAPPKAGDVVRVDPAEIAPTQAEYGSEEVDYDLKHWAKGKTAKEFEDYVKDKITKTIPGFYGPPISSAAKGGKDVIYITDGHHHSAALYRLLHDYDSLPDDVKALMSKKTQEDWLSKEHYLMRVEVKKVYKTPDEVLVALAHQDDVGIADSIARDPKFLEALKRVREAKGAPDAADLEVLKKAYSTLPATIANLKNSPLRSVMGIFFHKNDLSGGLFVDRIQFLLADKLKAKGFVIDTAPSKLKETLAKLDHAVFDDPGIMKFLQESSHPGSAAANAEQLKKARDAYLADAAAAAKGSAAAKDAPEAVDKNAGHINVPKLLKVICP